MPSLLMQRMIKNAFFSVALLCLAFVVGLSMKNLTMFAIPAVLAAVLAAGTVRMVLKYRNGSMFVWSGTCMGFTKSFLPTRLDYVFQNHEGESYVIKGRAAKEFRETLCYDLLFENAGDLDVPPNLIDSSLSQDGNAGKDRDPDDL